MRTRAQAKPAPIRPCDLRPTLLSQAIRTALPVLLGGALLLSNMAPADAVTPTEAGAVNATIDLVRQFSQRVSLAQSAGYLDEQVTEVDGAPRAARMSPQMLNFAPADVRPVPVVTGLPRRDGAGRPLGYCAWDNTSSTNVSVGGSLAYLAGNIPGNTDKLLYAVISPGRDGRIETSCADVLLLQQTIQSERGGGLGDDLVYARRPLQQSSRTFRATVSTAGNLPSTQNTEGDVRLVMDSNTLYAYNGGTWRPIGGSPDERFTGDGSGNLSYTGGKVTVADFEATTATISSGLTVNGPSTINGATTINGTLTATNLSGNGAGLTDLNAGNIATGTLAVARGGTGLSAAPAVNQILIGNGTGYDLSTLTAGNGIGVANAGGLLTISNTGLLSISSPMGTVNLTTTNGAVELDLPQSIAMTATPTFGGMMLNGALMGTAATFSGQLNANSVFANGQELKPITKTNIDEALTFASDTGDPLYTLPNLALGVNALAANKRFLNIAIGEGVLANLSAGTGVQGSSNVGLGYNAMNLLTVGSANTAIGEYTLANSIDGVQNTAIGSSSQRFSTVGAVRNTSVGSSTLFNNTTGRDNTALGHAAMRDNTTGIFNTSVGRAANWLNTTGSRNVALGSFTMPTNRTGSNNTIIGDSADVTVDGLTYAGAFGAGSRVGTSNTIAIGRNSITDQVVLGSDTRNDTFANTKLFVNGVTNLNGDLRGTTATFTGAVNALSFTGNGSGLTNLNAGNITTGIVPVANGGTGVNGSAAANGALLIGNGSGYTLGTLTGTAGQVIVTNGAGTITLSLPQSIATTSTPTFGGITLNGAVTGTTATFSGQLNAAQVFSNGQELLPITKTNIDNALTFPSQSGYLDQTNLGLGTNALGGAFKSGGNVAIGDGVLSQLDGTDTNYGEANTGVGYRALYANTTGYYNTAVGNLALTANTTGANNSAFGNNALSSNTTGISNIALGNVALLNNTTGYNNTATGRAALYYNTTGYNNTASGRSTLFSNTTGYRNTAIGGYALFSNTTGYNNTASGNDALYSNTTGFFNTATGEAALRSNTTGYSNTAVGRFALYLNTTGFYNTAVGGSALRSNTTGSYNTGMGLNALGLNSTGSANTAVGLSAMYNNTTGTANTVMGYEVMSNNTTGSGNTAIGSEAMRNNTGGINSVAIGAGALYAGTAAHYSTAVGYDALRNSTAIDNSAFGFNALRANTTGTDNTAVGKNTLRVSTTGNENVALGAASLYNATTASFNTAIGSRALYSATTGGSNVAIGQDAAYDGTNANNNVTIGRAAMRDVTSGSSNVAIGSFALRNITTGTGNLVLGRTAGQANGGYGAAITATTTGSRNTFLGTYSGAEGGSQTNYAAALGADSRVATSNTLVLGALGTNKTGSVVDDQVVIGATSRNDTYANTKLYVNGVTNLNGDLRGTTATFTGSISALGITGNGSGLTNLNAGNITTGIVPVANGGTGVNGSAAANGALLIGNGSGYTLGTLTGTADQVIITNGAGTITLSLPQSIAATSTPTFGGMVLNGGLIGTTAAFSGAVTAQRLNVNDSTGVVYGNLAIGPGALAGMQSGDGGNIAIGTGALNVNTSGSGNVAIGFNSQTLNTTGYGNQSIGPNTLRSNTTGFNNLAFGSDSLLNNTTGYKNVAIGRDAMYNNTSGASNSVLGSGALHSNTTGNLNSAFGESALQRNIVGFENTAMGSYALDGLTSGNNNVAIGSEAGSRDATFTLSSGSNNTFLGSHSGPSNGIATLNYATAIGSYAEVSTDNTIALGRNSNVDQIVIGTDTRNDTFANTKLYVNGVSNLNGDLHGTTATFSGALTAGSITASRLDIGTTAGGVTYPNLIVGLGAMQGAQSGSGSNAAIGIEALYANTTGYYNVATGNYALYANTTGYQNTAVGDAAMSSNSTGFQNTALGNSAMQLNSSGSYNTAVGNLALYANTTGSSNSVLGNAALYSNTTGYNNVAIGDSVMFGNTTGYNNAIVGFGALSNNTSGDNNAALGTNALSTNTIGERNVAVGSNSLYYNTSGYSNVALGNDAMYYNQYGARNVAIGERALYSNYDGFWNVAVGEDALYGNTTGYFNVALGNRAIESNTDGSANVAIGMEIMRSNTTGNENIAIGYHAFDGNTTGNNNVAIGQDALSANTTGSFNMALGYNANTSSGALSYATAIGAGSRVGTSSTIALGRNSTADQIVIGTNNRNNTYANTKLYVNGISNFNGAMYGTTATFSGALAALRLNVSSSTGVSSPNLIVGTGAMAGAQSGSGLNTAMGINSLAVNTSGGGNTAIGYAAGNVNATGSNNTLVGYAANPTSGALDYAAAIGASSTVATSDTLALGRNSAADQVVIGTDTRTGAHKLYVNGTSLGTAWNTTSDRRLKTDIVSLDTDMLLDKLGQFNAHRYRYIANPEAGYRIGVIAQDLQNLFPEVAGYNGGVFLSVDYNALGAMAAAGVGRLSTKFNTFEKFTKDKFDSVDKEITFLKTETAKIKGLEDWRDSANTRMDTMQDSIDKNLAKITENTLAIEKNTAQIKRLDEVLVTLDSTVKGQGESIEKINTRWSKNFAASEDGSLLTVTAAELKVNNFTAQQMRANAVYTQRLEAEMAAIRDLEVDNLKANTAVANTVQAKQVNTGAVQVYAGVGAPAFLFAAPGDGHYTINTSAMDGSYATATVIVNAGQAKVVTIASEGIELLATGNTIKALAAGKSIKASWIKTG